MAPCFPTIQNASFGSHCGDRRSTCLPFLTNAVGCGTYVSSLVTAKRPQRKILPGYYLTFIFTRVKLALLIPDGIAMTTEAPPSFTSFDGWKRIAYGNLATNALAVKRAAESGSSGPVLTFDDHTGCVLEVDTRGTDAEALARLPKESPNEAIKESESVEADQSSFQPRGRGRPKLGVISREVTLLPRHWDWLSAQSGGASVALRKLVEQAKRSTATREDRRRTQERTYQFMSAMAGDMAGFEESTRALFAADSHKFIQLVAQWPGDVRDYALALAAFDETKLEQKKNDR